MTHDPKMDSKVVLLSHGQPVKTMLNANDQMKHYNCHGCDVQKAHEEEEEECKTVFNYPHKGYPQKAGRNHMHIHNVNFNTG